MARMWSISVASARRISSSRSRARSSSASAARHAARDVAADRVGRRLVGDDVGRDAALDQRVHDVGDVGDEADRDRLAPLLRAEHHRERLVEVVGAVLQVALAQAAVDALGVDLDDERGGAGEHAGERLGAAHAAEAGRQHEAAGERAAEVLAPCRHERLVGALEDPLRADVLPGARRHAAEHREPGVDQLLPAGHGRPAADEVAVRDHGDRREPVRREEADRLARLHDERLVLLHRLERLDDAVEALPVARGLGGARVDDQLLGPLGVLEVVLEHAQDRLLPPALAAQLAAALGLDLPVGRDRH